MDGAMLLLYLTAGTFGIPVFAGMPAESGGIACILDGTGDYLIGFVLSAYIWG